MTDLNPDALAYIEDLARRADGRLIFPPTQQAIGEAGFVVLTHRDDEGFETIDLSPYRNNPRRQQGFIRVNTAQAFVDYVQRFGPDIAPSTVIVADRRQVTAVFNHHSTLGVPGWGDWGVILDLQYTPSWTGWSGFAGNYQTQESLANWLEENALDVIEPAAGTLLDIITNLDLTSQSKVQRRVNLQNGSVRFYFDEDFLPAGGTEDEHGTVTVPKGFTIRTQVFVDGPSFEIPILLRYRVKGGEPAWMFKFTGEVTKILEDALDNLTSSIAMGVNLPVYRGALK